MNYSESKMFIIYRKRNNIGYGINQLKVGKTKFDVPFYSLNGIFNMFL